MGGWGGGWFLMITGSHPTFCCVGVRVVVEVRVGHIELRLIEVEVD